VAGDCSLRQAIDASNGTATDDTINVPAGHYTLTIPLSGGDDDATGDLNINKAAGSVTIVGAGARSTTVDATGLGDRVFRIDAGSASISGLTITGGSPPANSTGLGNGEVGDGGGIQNNGTLTLSDSTVTGNTVGSTSVSNEGGGIANPGATAMTLIDDTVVGNSSSQYGGGVDIDAGTASITNTTITGNSGPQDGGGVDIDTHGAVAFVNDTITGNSAASGNGGGVWVEGSNVSFLNTIIAGNTAQASDVTDCNDASATDNGHNLQGTPTCFASTSNGDITGDPMLGPLQNNGGQTDTEALLDGSPAINAGDNSGCPATDQRGVTRPQGPACDIGAYEATPPFVQTLAASGVTQTAATLNGTVNPDNLATTYHFEYGLTTAYGSSTPTQSAGSDFAGHSESAAISGLSPGTTYHYRIVATNAIGTSDGADMTFKTASPPAPPPVIPVAVSKPLKLSVSPHTTLAGKRACYSFKATSGGHGVAGVTIRFTGRTVHTSSRGKARICETLRRHGTYTAHASKSGYRSATARVTVKAKPKPKPKPKFTG
jgi:hypothetical protein